VRILSLDLIAFGPFTDVVLDLSAGREGLHIVYGANEAGKSSALRALRNLLYGIPERSSDAFRHPFPKMRVGGTLRSAQGETLSVVRRKGRAGTLRASDDRATIAESELDRFLNGVDAGLFAKMFGIGYEDLIAGGREVVQGRGDLGRLIFSAGSGTANLSAVVDGLQAEADGLFRPSGQKQKINEAIGRLKQRRAELKEAQLPGQEWERHEQILKAALEAKAEVEDKLTAALRRMNRLQRIREAHPIIGRHRETVRELEAVADAVLLPEGFSERRIDAIRRLSVAESERDQAGANLAALRKAMSELEEPSSILDRTEEIEEIYQELGSYKKAAKDRISIETRCNTLRTEARDSLRSLREDLTIDEAERLRLKRPEALRIQELGAEYERIETRIEETRRKIPDHNRQIAAVEAKLQALPQPRSVEVLRTTLAAVEETLPLEKQLAAARAERQFLIQVCEQGAARLGLAAISTQDLGRLRAPTAETVRVFEERFDGLERRMSALAEETRKTEAALSETERRLEKARLEQEVPTEEDLQAVRELRDRGWRLIAATLEGRAAPQDEARQIVTAFPGQTTLAEAFEASIAKADETADRLRREAGRVAEKARLLADGAAQKAGLEKLKEQLAAARIEHTVAQAEWAEVWQLLGVPARSPREMRQWVVEFRALFEKASEALRRSAQCHGQEAEVNAAGSALARGLEAFGEPAEAPSETLAARYRRACKIVEAEEALALRREELGREMSRLIGELERLNAHLIAKEDERRRWQQEWEQAVKTLGLSATARPAEANAVMEELKHLFEKIQRAEAEQKRMDGIDRDAEAFRLKVKALAERMAADLAGRPAEEAALALQRRLTRAREAQSKRQTWQKQIDQAEAKLRKSTESIAAVESMLKGMCAEAGCRLTAELPEAERRSHLRGRLTAQLREIEERLLQLGGGADVADFIREASAVDPDGIAGDIARLEAEIAKLSLEKSDLDQRIGSERTELGRMDGGDKAPRIAEEIQAMIGGLEADVERYARLKIGGRVLALAMERFREKSQGSILKKASELFGRITCGSFAGLRPDHDSDGNPILVGVRNGGKEIVTVEGMSDGTADQLFLSLRLAGLEHYLDTNEALPFIVDDILIKFDNDRAAATLKVLAALSKKTQVIFFTHHRHLLQVAEGCLAANLMVLHHLI
jgi:uncharacterized protein YhaN